MTRADFERLCVPHMTGLKCLAMHLAREPEDAKDLVQETLIRALQSWESFEPRADVEPSEAALNWLRRILFNRFVESYRSRRRRATHYADFTDEVIAWTMTSAQENADPRNVPVEDRVDPRVLDALAHLNDEQRDCVRRVYLGGRLYRECAKEMGTPLGTVMTRLYRGSKKLREHLAPVAAEYGIGRRRAG